MNGLGHNSKIIVYKSNFDSYLSKYEGLFLLRCPLQENLTNSDSSAVVCSDSSGRRCVLTAQVVGVF